MIKQTRFSKGVTAVGLLCLFGQGCGPRSVPATHPRTAGLKTSPKPPKNPYRKVKPGQISKYLKTLLRSSQANRIREIGKEPAPEMSVAAREIAARLEREPQNLELAKQLARLLIREGRLVEAFSTLDRVRSLPATDPEIEGGLALIWHRLGSTSSALYHAQQAVLLDRSAANLALLGEIHLKRADYGEALVALNEALVSYPDSKDLVLALARAAAGIGDWEAARGYFERTLGIDPESVPAREGLATALVRLDETSGAFTVLRGLFETGEAYARLGQELAAAQRWSEARKALEKALEYFPDNRELALKLATVDSYLPFPTVASLKLGNGVAIDVENITVAPVFSVVELVGGQVLISAPERQPATGSDGVSAETPTGEVLDESSMDVITELGPYSSEPLDKRFLQRSVSPNVVELVELPMESRDPALSLAESRSASTADLAGSQTVSPASLGSAGPAAAAGWGGAELAQLPLSPDSGAIPLIDGKVAASDENGAAVVDPPESVRSILEAWGIPVEEAARDVPVDQPGIVPDTGQGLGSLPVSGPPGKAAGSLEVIEASTPPPLRDIQELPLNREMAFGFTTRSDLPMLQESARAEVEVTELISDPASSQLAPQVPVEMPPALAEAYNFTNVIVSSGVEPLSLSAFESVADPTTISMAAGAGAIDVEIDPIEARFVPAPEPRLIPPDGEDVNLEGDEEPETPVQTAPRVPPALVDSLREEARPLEPDLVCRLRGSAPASRAVGSVDSLILEDFGREDGLHGPGIGSQTATTQLPTIWLPLGGLALIALLGLFLRRPKPAALVVERDSGD